LLFWADGFSFRLLNVNYSMAIFDHTWSETWLKSAYWNNLRPTLENMIYSKYQPTLLFVSEALWILACAWDIHLVPCVFWAK
jgi:hypothetical protein